MPLKMIRATTITPMISFHGPFLGATGAAGMGAFSTTLGVSASAGGVGEAGLDSSVDMRMLFQWMEVDRSGTPGRWPIINRRPRRARRLRDLQTGKWRTCEHRGALFSRTKRGVESLAFRKCIK